MDFRTQRVIDPTSEVRTLHRGHEVRAAVTTPDELKQKLKEHRADPAAIRRLRQANDLLNVNWLILGLRAARSVARVDGDEPGTAFMISPSLAMTNHHVFPDERAALAARLVFNDELDANERPKRKAIARLEPWRFFLTSPTTVLDMTVVAVDRSAPIARFGYLPLMAKQGKLDIDDHVTIIQHPNGASKQIALRSNRVVDIDGDFVRYETDTQGGSSGSPVFNDQWQVVALHHRSLPVTDVDGSAVSRTGHKLPPGQYLEDREWLSNEGVRVSSIVAFIRAAIVPSGSEERLHRALLRTFDGTVTRGAR
jgi:endonuclease G